MKTIKNRKGFTIVEIIIAIIVLTVGVLGMVTTAALVTRMIARGQRSGAATAFAQRRLERMRVAACIPAQRVNGTDTLYRGSTWTSINQWTYTDLGNLNYRLKIVSRYKTTQNKLRRDSTETTITCNNFL
jgi:Tfp pilus assembly protein PilV